ncbi:hypothetical protein GCM10007853_21610 [Algimonas ampicilliniresistens]|uniref:Response regulatory domain-containing protein n=1 Tax=Algimonas ampicilliniresistens TaxID=1298735 RepID=A0ABQ5VBC3_9PROT|nr:hypothetical protein [Algimonas ampicilliniresistens]GLQ24287.1 hypothetical protein GCM10007853_21610 [Algimonas ampicilliniresistens]
MDNTPSIFSILLIDEDTSETQTIRTILKSLTDAPFSIDHVLKCSQALGLLRERRYELVLLEKQLSQRISARFSVPMIKAAIQLAPIAIMSKYDTSFSHADPVEHGVDYVIDKANMADFLRSQLNYLLGIEARPYTASRPINVGGALTSK